MITAEDEKWMKLAFEQAALSIGRCDPNPAVGAVIVDGETGQLIATGHTEEAGKRHAEIVALDAARVSDADLKKAVLYVTLEPCNHHGRTPPCVDRILAEGVKEVVMAEWDRHPSTAGSGSEKLKAGGVMARWLPFSLFEEEKFHTLHPFFHKLKTGRTFLWLKWAQNAAGETAPATDQQVQISSAEAMAWMHALRRSFLFTGATPGTIRTDRPSLLPRNDEFPLKHPPRSGGFLAHLISIFSQPDFRKSHRLIFPGHHPGDGWPAYLDGLAAEKNAFTTIAGPEFLRDQVVAAGLDFQSCETLADLPELCSGFPENQLILEAGPQAADFLIRNSLADGLMVYRMKTPGFEPPGRSFPASREIAGDCFSLPVDWIIRSYELENGDLTLFRPRFPADENGQKG